MSIVLATMVALFAQNLAVRGIVLKGVNDPLSKAVVELRTDDRDGRLITSATTEEDGLFNFTSVRPGRYRLVVVRTGYVRPPMTITVVDGQPVDVRLQMTSTGAIYGLVLDNKGEPLGNIEVQAFKASYSGGQRVLRGVQAVHTNDLGEYRLFWLPPGRYYIAAVHPKAQGLTRIIIGSFTSAALGNGPGSFYATGTVDPAIVNASRADRLERYVPVYFPGTTNEQLATPIEIRAGAEFGGVNIVVASVRPRHVRGVVIDGTTGNPGEYSSIEAAQDVPLPRTDEPKVTPGTGAFDLELLPGTHTLTGRNRNGSGSVTIQVGDQDIENLNVVTTPYFNLEGRLIVEGRVSSADIEQLRLTLRPEPPPVRERPATSSYSTARSDGAFLLEASSGDFRVNVAPILNVSSVSFPIALPKSLQNAYVKSIRLGNVDVLNNGLHLERPTTTPLEIVLGTKPGTIEGTVRNSGRQAAVDMMIVLVPDIRRRFDLYKTATTDTSGRFHFDRVPPGDYKLFAWPEVEGDSWFDPQFMRNYENLGMALRVSEDSTENVQVIAIE